VANLEDIKLYYTNILQREAGVDPDGVNEADSWAAAVDSNTLTLDQVRSFFVNSDEANNVEAVIRVYQAAFGRVPDKQGLKDQVTALQNGAQLSDIAKGFSDSPEFSAKYGSTTVTDAYITSLYVNVLGRIPAASEVSYWKSSGDDASTILYKFSQSEEFQVKSSVAISNFLDGAGKGEDVYEGKLDDYSPGGQEPEPVGQTFALTASVDPIVGTDGADTINGLLNIDGINTLNALDSIDGGNGVDTLNISIGAGANSGIPVSASIKNVEIVNLVSDGGKLGSTVDASRFVGAGQIWQIDAANNVTKLAAGTTVGFKGIVANDAANLKVSAAATAASVSIALDNVVGEAGTNVSELSVEGAALNSVMISGSLAPAEEGEPDASLAVGVKVGNDASGKVLSSLTVNTSVDTTLIVTGAISTLAAGESTGGITYTGTPTVSSITTGSGDDNVSINFVTSKATSTVAAKDASVYTADGDDIISVSDANGTGTTKVDAGHGDNTIAINGNTSVDAKMEVISGDGIDIVNVAGRSGTVNLSVGKGDDEITLGTGYKALTVDAGEGDDSVTLSNGLSSLKTGYSIDGGDGIDTVVVAGKTLAAADYVALNDVLKNFEAVEFTSKATVDASRVSGYKEITFNSAAVLASQAEVAAKQTAKIDADELVDTKQTAKTDADELVDTKQTAKTDADELVDTKEDELLAAQDGNDPDAVTEAENALESAQNAATTAASELTAAQNAATTAASELAAAQIAATTAASELMAAEIELQTQMAADYSTVTHVSADQVLVAEGSVDATADGYVAEVGSTPATYEGALNIKALGNQATITAKAQSVDLKVDASDMGYVGVALEGDVKTATVTLTNGQTLDADKNVDGDTIAYVYVTASATELKNMTELTLNGSGSAYVTNEAGSKLTVVDASSLGGSVTFGDNEGDALQGMGYNTVNTAAETIKLGSGIDNVFFHTGSSTVLKADTVEGLNLVADVDGKLDVDASDMIGVAGIGNDFKVAEEVTGSTLNLVLKNLAESSTTDDAFVFQFEGNTYAFADLDDDTISDTDVLVKVVGTVDSELMAASLNHGLV
jgi:hypothetical protein